VPEQDMGQFFLRGGRGAEIDVAGGTVSLNVNITTQGDDPTIWLRSGWKVTFGTIRDEQYTSEYYCVHGYCLF
jgi:hypothetical protein